MLKFATQSTSQIDTVLSTSVVHSVLQTSMIVYFLLGKSKKLVLCIHGHRRGATMCEMTTELC